MIVRHKYSPYLAILCVLVCSLSSVSAVAVMSVDLGTEWMKVAVVSVSNLFLSILLDYQASEYNIKTLHSSSIYFHLAWRANGNCT